MRLNFVYNPKSKWNNLRSHVDYFINYRKIALAYNNLLRTVLTIKSIFAKEWSVSHTSSKNASVFSVKFVLPSPRGCHIWLDVEMLL